MAAPTSVDNLDDLKIWLSKGLLKELEEFASRGCPDLKSKTIDTLNTSITQNECIIEEQKKKQKKIIEELKVQLQDLESYAYEVRTHTHTHTHGQVSSSLSWGFHSSSQIFFFEDRRSGRAHFDRYGKAQGHHWRTQRENQLANRQYQ